MAKQVRLVRLARAVSAAAALLTVLGAGKSLCQSVSGHPLYQEQLSRAVELLLEMKVPEAQAEVDTWIAGHPDSPAGYFFRSASLFWQMFLQAEGVDSESLRRDFQQACKACRLRAEKDLNTKGGALEGAVYLGAVYGQEALLALLDHRYLVMVPKAKLAWDYLRQAAALDPDYYDNYFGLGMYQYFCDVLPKVTKLLASLFGFEGSREKGLANINLAVEKGIYSPDAARIMLLNIYSIIEMPDSSIGNMAGMLRRRFPENPLIHWRYGDILFRLQDYRNARRIYQEVKARVDSDYPYYRNRMFSVWSMEFRIGMCDMHQGQREQALQRFEHILDQGAVTPDWIVPFCHLRCGEIYLQQGDRTRARSHLKAVLEYEDVKDSHISAEALLKALETP